MIILSLVRSNTEGSIGRLIRDWRRINVAFTRSKSKLIIIGSELTISNDKLLLNFITFMKQNKWIYELPENCLSYYKNI